MKKTLYMYMEWSVLYPMHASMYTGHWAGRVGRGNFFGTDDSCEIFLVMYNESFIRKV